MKHTITIRRTAQGYTVQHTDPVVIELFGGDTIQTAFTPVAKPTRVLSEITRLNPQCNVILVKQ